MEKNTLIEKLTVAIKESNGDWGRNQYLLKVIKNNREIANSDKKYLENILKIDNLVIPKDTKEKLSLTKKDKSIFLNPNLVKCKKCEKSIKLDDKSLRLQNYYKSTNNLNPLQTTLKYIHQIIQNPLFKSFSKQIIIPK